MTHITIPTSLDEAITSLTGLDSLLTAKAWERAAIVRAFTRDGEGGTPNHRSDITTVPMLPREFAELGIAGLRSDQTVRRYRNAWQAAIDAGLAIDVHPGQVAELPDMDWSDAAPKLRDERPSKQDIALRGDPGAVMQTWTPEQKTEAVLELMTNPDVASQVLSDQVMQTKVRKHLTTTPPPWKPQDAETEARIRQAELAARERELVEQDHMDRILGSTEILRDLVPRRDYLDEFVTLWSNRRIRLADEEQAAYDSEVAALQRAVDQVRTLGEGRDSLEDELQRLAEEQQR